jgi:hypothetical protein
MRTADFADDADTIVVGMMAVVHLWIEASFEYIVLSIRVIREIRGRSPSFQG